MKVRFDLDVGEIVVKKDITAKDVGSLINLMKQEAAETARKSRGAEGKICGRVWESMPDVTFAQECVLQYNNYFNKNYSTPRDIIEFFQWAQEVEIVKILYL